MTTKYEKIKRTVMLRKEEKSRKEGQLESLKQQEQELFDEASKIIGKEISTVEEIQQFTKEEGEEITSLISKMEEILEEGDATF